MIKKMPKHLLATAISAVLVFLSLSASASELKNEKSLGLMIGDPIALSLRVPLKENTFLNIHAGVWTWAFWHDIHYNTPYLSVDHVWLFPGSGSYHNYYIGAGVAGFFHDNTKDKRDYDAAAAVRIPLGYEIYSKDKLSVVFELAPIYQFAPAYNAVPYIIELNGGLITNWSF